MAIRSSLKGLFLSTLRESPAWEELIDAVLEMTTFMEDEGGFKSGGLGHYTVLNPLWIEGNPTTLTQGVQYQVHLDCNALLSIKDALIFDGNEYTQQALCRDTFTIKPLISADLSNFVIINKEFYTQYCEPGVLKQLTDSNGITNPLKINSDFDQFSTKSSFKAIGDLTKEEGLNIDFDYLYDNQGVPSKGSKVELVENAVKVYKLDGLVYYEFKSIINSGSYLVGATGEHQILSVDSTQLVLDSDIESGIYSLKRNYQFSSFSKGSLLSYLELGISDMDRDLATKLANRITPYRCELGFRGAIDKSVIGEVHIGTIVNRTRMSNTMGLHVDNNISLRYNEQIIQDDCFMPDLYGTLLSSSEYESISLYENI